MDTIVNDPEPGSYYNGRVTRLMDFGAFVEIAPGKEGLVHISRLDTKRTEHVTDVVNVGDIVKVKVLEIGRQGEAEPLPPGRPHRPGRGGAGERHQRGAPPAAGITATGTAAPDGTMTGDKHMTVFDGKIPTRSCARRDFRGGLLAA